MSLSVDLRLTLGDFTLEARFASSSGALALFGPSGAGKSTLLQCIAGLRRAEGSVTLHGEELNQPFQPPERRGMGVVFQDDRLFPHLNAHDNLTFGQRLTPAAQRRVSEAEVVELLELGDLLKRRVHGLSGGERRRLSLGRALLCSPRLLLLDEPLVGLDGARRERMLRLLLRTREALNIPTVLVSHQVVEVLRLSEEVVAMSEGRVLGQGPFFETLGQDAVFRMAEGMGLDNALPVVIEAHDPEARISTVRLGEVTLRLPLTERVVGEAATLLLRPEDILLATGPVEGLSARNQLPGVVRRLDPVHGRVLVTVEVGGVAVRAELTGEATRALGLVVGAPAWALIKATALRWA